MDKEEQTINNPDTVETSDIQTKKMTLFQEITCNMLQNQPAMLVDCFKNQKKRDRYLFLFSTYIVYSKNNVLDYSKPTRIKVLNFNFDLGFYVKTGQEVLKKFSALKFINMQNKCSDTFYHQNEAVAVKWAKFLFNYINQIGIQQYYKTIRHLGKGVSAEVYLAERISDNREFAIKVFNKTKNNQKCQNAFKNEIKILRLLNHPNIIKLYGVFVSSQYIYAILEYLAGGTLYDEIKQKKIYKRDQYHKIIINLIQGLDHLRLKRIVHRDMKLENILIRLNENKEKTYVICDFGLATWIDEKAYIFQKCGTPGYIAPQILRHPKEQKMLVDTKSDIFSLGAIIHLVMLSRPVFSYKGDFKQLLKLNKKCAIDFRDGKYKALERYELELLEVMLDDSPKSRYSLEEILKLEYFKVRKEINKSEMGSRKNLHDQDPHLNSKRILKSVDRAGSVEIKEQKKIGFNRNASLNKNITFQKNKQQKSSFLDFFFKKKPKQSTKAQQLRLNTRQQIKHTKV